MSSEILSTALVTLVAVVAAPGGSPVDDPTVLLTLEEALELAFPGCAIERESVGLTEEESERIAELAGTGPSRRLVVLQRATREGEPVGTAYVDVHRVRTMRESLFVVVDPEGRVARVELLAFAEPKEYAPRAKWYGQFVGRALDEELSLKGGIRRVAGATLSSHATVDAVRRVLAQHRVIAERRPPEPEEVEPPPAEKKEKEKKKAKEKGTPPPEKGAGGEQGGTRAPGDPPG